MGKQDDNGNRRRKKDTRRKTAKASKNETASTKEDDEKDGSQGTPAPVEVVEEEKIPCDTKVEISTQEAEPEESVDVEANVNETPVKQQITTSPDLSAKKMPDSSTSKKSNNTTPTTTPTNVNKKSKKRRSSGTSSDEERWLTAIESGKLEDVDDEMKKIKDPKLMTARQRAMYDRSQDKEPSPGGEQLIALPSGYREKEKPQTAEEIQKAVLKSQKRKQQADERREKDKKKTMERLLKKQDSSKQRGAAARNKLQKPVQPMISYKNTLTGAVVQMPSGHDFPLKAQTPREPPKPQLCGVSGCSQRKVYNCAQTNVPLCSLQCYRKNLANVN